MNHTILHSLHQTYGAHFKSYDNFQFELPSHFTSIDDEYKVVAESCGLLDFSFYGRLRLTGKDSIDLLDRLSTNDLKDLETGQLRKTVLTNEKGRIVDWVTLYRNGESDRKSTRLNSSH